MILNKKSSLTAIIPVRKGSKGIPCKNTYRLGKDTLLERTIKMAQRCGYIDEILVSTDCTEMFALSQKHITPRIGLRPQELATDTASTISVITHSLIEAKISDTHVILLQVTTPLRTLDDLNQFICEFDNDPNATSSVSLTPFDSPHPDKIQKIENGVVKSYLNKESMVARQLLPKVYALNGAFYIAHSEQLLRYRSFFSDSTKPFIMPKEKSINLDSKWDLILLEALIAKQEVTIEEYN